MLSITAEKNVNVSAKVVAESKTNSEKVVNNNANIQFLEKQLLEIVQLAKLMVM